MAVHSRHKAQFHIPKVGHRQWRVDTRHRGLFQISRASEFRRMVVLWWPLLPLTTFLFAFFGAVLLWKQPWGLDEFLHIAVSVFSWGITWLGIWLLNKPQWLMARDQWIPWGAAAVIHAIAAGVAHHQSPAFIQYSLFWCTLTVVIVMWALKPSLRAAVKFLVLGSASGVIIWIVGRQEVAYVYMAHFVISGLVCLFCVLLRTEQDHDEFKRAMRLFEAEARLKELNQGLDDLVHRDALTGLLNRRALNDALHREWQRSARTRVPLSILMIDIDHFKVFNDRYGHLEGDSCLISVAHALRKALQRPADIIARYGGEEFVVVLPDTDQKGAQEVAQRLLENVDDLGLPHPKSPVASHVTISLGGVTVMGQRLMTIKEALDLADQALYRAKAAGRHQFSMHAVPQPSEVAKGG